ncbi:hypothetical protein EV216_11026 [Rhodovulum steppense]|uniref:Uncharacterized protein n=1 Tax=Rhodovulum steppense TaxID=540251 RepID=A0A4R1YUF2_9RHOB|nr:hypothetical protein EV216_11026 [Rhodovulum steppense]
MDRQRSERHCEGMFRIIFARLSPVQSAARTAADPRATPGLSGEQIGARPELVEYLCLRPIPTSVYLLLRRPVEAGQNLSIRYTGLSAEAGVDTSVGIVGDSRENALAESIIGQAKAEMIQFLGSRKSVG